MGPPLVLGPGQASGGSGVLPRQTRCPSRDPWLSVPCILLLLSPGKLTLLADGLLSSLKRLFCKDPKEYSPTGTFSAEEPESIWGMARTQGHTGFSGRGRASACCRAEPVTGIQVGPGSMLRARATVPFLNPPGLPLCMGDLRRVLMFVLGLPWPFPSPPVLSPRTQVPCSCGKKAVRLSARTAGPCPLSCGSTPAECRTIPAVSWGRLG